MSKVMQLFVFWDFPMYPFLKFMDVNSYLADRLPNSKKWGLEGLKKEMGSMVLLFGLNPRMDKALLMR